MYGTNSNCSACRDGVLNQLGHMDEGGCLYVEESNLNNDKKENDTKEK